MKRIVHIPLEAILPSEKEILSDQGVPDGAELSKNVFMVLKDAMVSLAGQSRPIGLLLELSLAEFEPVFHGEGKNETPNPFQTILPPARHLALFILTLGKEVSETIETCFQENDPALGSMLDSGASLAADKASVWMESFYRDYLKEKKECQDADAVLSYSPGYCGWHITGQRKLFEILKPEDIGITLNESCLMTPLKSISGVLVAGPREIHQFQNRYFFCKTCRTISCQERMRRLGI